MLKVDISFFPKLSWIVYLETLNWQPFLWILILIDTCCKFRLRALILYQVEKEKNAVNQDFFFFPTMFYTFEDTCLNIWTTLICHLQTLSVWMNLSICNSLMSEGLGPFETNIFIDLYMLMTFTNYILNVSQFFKLVFERTENLVVREGE